MFFHVAWRSTCVGRLPGRWRRETVEGGLPPAWRARQKTVRSEKLQSLANCLRMDSAHTRDVRNRRPSTVVSIPARDMAIDAKNSRFEAIVVEPRRNEDFDLAGITLLGGVVVSLGKKSRRGFIIVLHSFSFHSALILKLSAIARSHSATGSRI